MSKTALFGSIAAPEHFNTLVLVWLGLCAVVSPFSSFAAASFFVVPFWGLTTIFVVSAFERKSLIAWRATSLATKLGLFLFSLVALLLIRKAGSPPLLGLAIFAVGTGILGFLMRAAFSHALSLNEKESENIQ